MRDAPDLWPLLLTVATIGFALLVLWPVGHLVLAALGAMLGAPTHPGY